jgi:hypothetical protein
VVPVPAPPKAERTKVLSSVVAPCKVKAPGVVVEPMVLILEAPPPIVLVLEAPEPKVLVSEAPVPIVELPDEVNVVKAPVLGVPEPIGPGAAKVAPFRELAFKLATLVVEATTKGAVPVARVEVIWPLALMVVKAPVRAVVAPIAVELMPVAVVLKLDEVKVRALAPGLIEEALRPVSDRAPEVAVRFKAPVVRVRPLLAVSSPAEVIVPEPVVEILPEVESVPSSLMVSLEAPPDWISMAVLVPTLVSFRIKAVAVPC